MQWKAVHPAEDCPTVEQLEDREGPRHRVQPRRTRGVSLQGELRQRRDHVHRAPDPTRRGDRRRHPRSAARHAGKVSGGPCARAVARCLVAVRARRGGVPSRASRRGLTLIEIIVVLRSSRSSRGWPSPARCSFRRRGCAGRSTLMTSAIKVAYTRATATSQDLRLVMDLDQPKIWLEESDRRRCSCSRRTRARPGRRPGDERREASARRAQHDHPGAGHTEAAVPSHRIERLRRDPRGGRAKPHRAGRRLSLGADHARRLAADERARLPLLLARRTARSARRSSSDRRSTRTSDAVAPRVAPDGQGDGQGRRGGPGDPDDDDQASDRTDTAYD